MAEIAVVVAVAFAVVGVASCSTKIALTRLRVRRRDAMPVNFEIGEVGRAESDVFPELVLFTTPYCVPCRRIKGALDISGVDLVVVDLSVQPGLARRFDVRTTPTLFELDSDGEILGRHVNSAAEEVSSRRTASSRS